MIGRAEESSQPPDQDRAPGGVALVHDYLLVLRGAERSFAAMADRFPNAPLYTLLYDEEGTRGRFAGHPITTSFLQKLGVRQDGFRKLLPLFPSAVERLPVSEADVVLSSSSAFAHGVQTRTDAVHVCYCYTPLRYAWFEQERALAEVRPPLRPALRAALARARAWDRKVSQRVTRYVAISELSRERIAKYLERDAEIVYPPVEIERFTPGHPEDFFLVVCELVRHKRVELALEAARRARVRVVVVGSGPERERLSALYGDVAHFKGRASDEELAALYASTLAVIVPSLEEFGITAVEAQAAGRPVLAADAGGARETVVSEVTGIHFAPGDVDAAAEALREVDWTRFDPRQCREQAERFSVGAFQNGIVEQLRRAGAAIDDDSALASTRNPRQTRRSTAANGRSRSRVDERFASARAVVPKTTAATRDRLHVLLVNHTSHISGAEYSLQSLIAGLQAAGVRCTLACPKGASQDLARSLGIETLTIVGTEGSLRLHPKHTPRAMAEIGCAAAQVAAHARRLKVDLIHANSIRASLVAGLASQISRRPAIAHLRDRLPPSKASKASLRLIGATCRHVIANSHYTVRAVDEAGVRGPASVVYNPVDLELFRPLPEPERAQARAGLGLEPGTFALGVVGQITPWKAQDVALRAITELAGRQPNLRLLIVGEAKFLSKAARFDNRAYLEYLHELAHDDRLEGRVDFLGERSDAAAIMSSLDALLLPSRGEPFGRVAIEAMAAGTPVIASAAGGPAELIEDGVTGLLVPMDDIGAWGAAIERLVTDDQMRQRLIDRGRERSTDFSVSAHAEEVLARYRAVLDAPLA